MAPGLSGCSPGDKLGPRTAERRAGLERPTPMALFAAPPPTVLDCGEPQIPDWSPVHPQHDKRPWGSFTVLADEATFKVKKIVVQPGRRLSYQHHSHRSEHWFVVTGIGQVMLDGEALTISAGAAVDVPRGVAHRIENQGEHDLVFIEVQHGDYFGEDDIVRLDDDYGRVN